MYTRTKLLLFVSLLVLASLACTALGSSDEAPAAVDTPPVVLDDPPADDPAEEPPAGEDPESGGAALEGEACLIGTWQLDNDSYLAFLQGLAAASSAAGDLSYESVDGTALVTFSDDGTVSNSLEGFAFTACSGGNCNDFQVPGSAATSFSYSADSGVITFDGGQIVAANFGEFEGSDLYGETTIYTCSGDTLTTQYGGLPTILWSRVP